MASQSSGTKWQEIRIFSGFFFGNKVILKDMGKTTELLNFCCNQNPVSIWRISLYHMINVKQPIPTKIYIDMFIVSLLHWNLTLSMMPSLSSLATAAVIICCLNKDVHIIIALELETWHYTNTVMIGSTRGYHNNNLQSPQWWQQFDGSVQERRNSSALAMELRLSWMNQPSWHHHLGRNLDMCWPAYIIIMITDVSAPNIYQAISNQHADLLLQCPVVPGRFIFSQWYHPMQGSV